LVRGRKVRSDDQMGLDLLLSSEEGSDG
jgi:hypothetical protein